ncbi:MAG TPA: hypothetical protein DDZ88_24965 [Verrucomicrobiales bacterium]|nr:hypothetical protein [Verrucomicrobiales bacterium]
MFSEVLPHDAVSRGWSEARTALGDGADRQVIAERLASVVAKHPESWWHDRAKALVVSLNGSAQEVARLKTAGITAKNSPSLWLAESKMPLHIVAYQPANQESLTAFVQRHPDDPASMVLSQGREIIPRLMPLLEDMGSTRATHQIITDETALVRVCDLALAIIELKSGCSFCERMFSFGWFSNQSAIIRQSTRKAVEAWWADAGTVTYEHGIRIGMKGAGFYGKVRMAALLMDSKLPEDRAFAVQTLRNLVNLDGGNLQMAVHAGEVLEAHGDDYCRKAVVQRLKEAFSKSATSFDPDSSAIFFLAEHGGKEEWSLLTQCAEAQLLAGEAGGGHFILPTLMNSNQVATSKFAIPALALALRAKQVGPKVFYGSEDRLREKVWKAMVNMQTLTGESFGVTPIMPDASESPHRLKIGGIAPGNSNSPLNESRRWNSSDEHVRAVPCGTRSLYNYNL